MIGKKLEKWTKAELIEEVKRLRGLTKSYIADIMELKGIKGKVTSEEIDAALRQHTE